MIPAEVLQAFKRYHGLSDEALAWLGERMVRKEFIRGEVIFHEADECRHFYLLKSGTVKICRRLESGRELILHMVRSGEAVGEAALVDRQGYPATAVAHDDAVVLLLNRADYFAFLERFPKAALATIGDLTHRMRRITRRLEDLGGGTVDFRVARVLLMLSRRSSLSIEQYDDAPVPLTRQEIADLVGARVETVIRIMSKWEKAGYIETTSEGIKLHNRRPLLQVAGGEEEEEA